MAGAVVTSENNENVFNETRVVLFAVSTKPMRLTKSEDSLNGNKLDDQVFWYKASDRGEFKIGADDYWQYSQSNYVDKEKEEMHNGYKNTYVVDKKY